MEEVKQWMETFGKHTYYTTRDRISSQETIEVNGVSAVFPSYFIKNFSWTFESEQPVLRDLLDTIVDEDVFYDVGAHAGLYSALVGQLADTLAAFEPYPPNVKRLRRHLQWNDVNADIYPYALSDKRTDTANLAGEMVQIESQIGHELIESEGIAPPDVIKIDVEGAELAVLRGLGRFIEECRLIYCEVHPELLDDRQSAPDEVFEFLEENGFKVETLVVREETNRQPIVRAKR